MSNGSLVLIPQTENASGESDEITERIPPLTVFTIRAAFVCPVRWVSDMAQTDTDDRVMAGSLHRL